MKDDSSDPLLPPNRRQFLQLGAMVTAALKLDNYAFADTAHPSPGQSMIGVPFEVTKNPRIGFIGVGGRGTNLLQWFLAQNAQVVAICDVVPEKAEHAGQLTEKAGQKAPPPPAPCR